ncbi:MAG: hypothetical protein HRU17_12670, partial [Polyangiaceae bacterium]|nr:hypothetical protein [Polyangiaceae bacterium]
MRRFEIDSDAERLQATPEVRPKMADRVHPTPLSSIFDVIRETGAALATLSGLSARRERRDAADFDVTVLARLRKRDGRVALGYSVCHIRFQDRESPVSSGARLFTSSPASLGALA